MEFHTEIQSAPQIVRNPQNSMSQMANVRRDREISRLQGSQAQNWTNWVKAMVPPNTKGNNLEARGQGQVGSICTNIRSAFPDKARNCGIYEWRAKGTLDDQPNYIAYVGSTCRDKPRALRRRINEYCTDGSYKAKLMNEALTKRYELWVRVKTSEGRDNAEYMENKLLEKYDYAWNKRINRRIRDILP